MGAGSTVAGRRGLVIYVVGAGSCGPCRGKGIVLEGAR